MTFKDVWMFAGLHSDVPDPMLWRGWAQWAYNEFCDRKSWSHLRASTTMLVADQKAGTVTVSQGSPTVVGGTLVFAASDVGRAFRLSSIPIYTIVAVSTAGPTSATLDQNYGEVSAVGTAATILDAYITMPENFHRFRAILDPINRWRLRWWIQQETLDKWDPARQSTGNPRLLANNQYSPVPGQTTRPRFELYPYQTAARSFPTWYYRKAETLADGDVLMGPLAARGMEILVDGILSRCALWPGTAGKKNPYFSPTLAETHRKLFEDKVADVFVQDDELYFETLPMADFGWADFPWDAAWLQSHEPWTIG